jgi:glycosidase
MTFSKTVYKHFLKSSLIALLLSGCISLKAKKDPVTIDRVDPPCWWTCMEMDTIQITLHGKNIADFSQVSTNYSGFQIIDVAQVPNKNYLFLTACISQNALPGNATISCSSTKSKKPIQATFEIRKRNGYQPKGLHANDAIYLVFPDRFINGNTDNDAFAYLNEKQADRNGLKSRHGGDLQGLQKGLDYIKDLGFTSIWINPVLENNQPYESYHGYAATDLYKIDPRFGSNELYKQLVNDIHAKDMKVIWDVVYNHWGNANWMFVDLPDSNWVHWYPNFTRTSYRAETLMDPYASQSDKKQMTDGWFDHHMPDLNQQNTLLATYLIQNSIWWIEYAGIDAFRIDTYAYPDQLFMKKLNEAIMKEYSNFFIFGETWVQGSPIQAWFTKNNPENRDYSSSLHGVTDFQLFYAITKGLNENFGWEEGFRRIELTLAQDILYENAYNNVTHLDNHDLSRFYSAINEDFNKWKMGIALLLTLRGIPQVYYGTEILMKNYANPDALVREDFPGGWSTDSIQKFTAEGRSAKENEAYNYISSLLNWRKQNPWFGASKLIQFVPEENTYVYFRIDGNKTVMCAFNLNEKDIELDLNRFQECLKGRTRALEITSGARVNLSEKLVLSPKSNFVYELKP